MDIRVDPGLSWIRVGVTRLIGDYVRLPVVRIRTVGFSVTGSDKSTAPNDTEGAPDFLWDAGGQGGFQVGQTAKARLGHRVQSLRKGHGRQRLLSEKLSNLSAAGGY